MSSKQFYGPRVGALVVRGTVVHNMLHGGGQEGGLRPGWVEYLLGIYKNWKGVLGGSSWNMVLNSEFHICVISNNSIFLLFKFLDLI